MEQELELELLADNFEAHKTVALWYFDEWVSETPGVTIDRVEKKLAKAINRETAPLLVLAKEYGKVIGAAELKLQEMEIYPEYKYWLGGVYVEHSQRSKVIAKSLTFDVLSRARKIGISKLYLQTEDLFGGLYAKCGFAPIETVDYNGREVLVMVADLDG